MPRICVELDCDGNGNGGPQIRTYETIVGDGQQTDFLIQHNLGTQDVLITARNLNTGEQLTDLTVVANNVNSTLVRFDTAPAAQSVRVFVLGVVPAP